VRNDKEFVMLRKYGLATVRALAPLYAWLQLTRVQALNTTLWSGIPLIVAFSSFAVASPGAAGVYADVEAPEPYAYPFGGQGW
jgi:ATP-binding cassette subfamily C (CFTR/MRP) protein 1